MRFTDEERDALAVEIERIVFIQAGLRTREGVEPMGAVRKAMGRGLMRDLTTAFENIATNGVRD